MAVGDMTSSRNLSVFVNIRQLNCAIQNMYAWVNDLSPFLYYVTHFTLLATSPTDFVLADGLESEVVWYVIQPPPVVKVH